jgi:hypothetical protein
MDEQERLKRLRLQGKDALQYLKQEKEKAGVAGSPKAGIAGSPKAGIAGSPKAGIAGSPKAGIAGSPKAGIAGSPKVGIAGSPKLVGESAKENHFKNLPRGSYPDKWAKLLAEELIEKKPEENV